MSLPPEPPESFGWVSMMVVSILGAANWRARSNKRCVRRARFLFKRDKNKKQGQTIDQERTCQTDTDWIQNYCAHSVFLTMQELHDGYAVLSQVLNWQPPSNTLLALQESQMPPSFGRSSPHCYADLWKHGRKNKKNSIDSRFITLLLDRISQGLCWMGRIQALAHTGCTAWCKSVQRQQFRCSLLCFSRCTACHAEAARTPKINGESTDGIVSIASWRFGRLPSSRVEGNLLQHKALTLAPWTAQYPARQESCSCNQTFAAYTVQVWFLPPIFLAIRTFLCGPSMCPWAGNT